MPDQKEASTTLPSTKTILIVVVLIGAGLMQWYCRSVPKKNGALAQEQKSAPTKVPSQQLQNILIPQNLHRLADAQAGYLRAHPGKTAKFADLVGPSRTVAKLDPVAGEKYPAEFPPGTDPVAILPDGIAMGFDPMSGQAMRSLPNSPNQDLVTVKYVDDFVTYPDPVAELQAMLEAASGRDQASQRIRQNALITRLQTHSPSPTFLRQVRAFLEDRSNSKEGRDLLFDTFVRSRTPASVRLLIQLASTSPDPDLRQAAIKSLSTESEANLLLEKVWCESNGEQLLAAVSLNMARLGRPDDIELLLDAALAPDPESPGRTAIAQHALQAITRPEAVPPLTARLAGQPAMSSGGKALASVLVRIGDEAAAKAVVGWLQKADEDATVFIQTLGPRPRNPELRAAWTAALDPAIAYRNEQNREAIRTYLAPVPVLHPLKNGSFEDGTFQGFTLEGSGRVVNGWANITATDGKFMAYLDTMENPVSGISTLTTDSFEVPAGMKTLLFDYNFAGSVLLCPVAQVLECYILTDTETRRIDLFATTTAFNIYQIISHYDQGTGFRTECIPVEAWAGTGTRLRVKFVLHGRGRLPERIPGMNRDDHNPLGGNTPGTALFLDNFRLTPNARTALPPIPPEAVTIAFDGTNVTIKTTPGAFPPGSTIYIWEIDGPEHALELGANNQVVFSDPFTDPDVRSANYLFGYATAAGSDGPMFSPQIRLRFER